MVRPIERQGRADHHHDGRRCRPIVWVVGVGGDNQLHAFDAATGETLFAGGGVTMSGVHRFSTLIAANRHLYVAADRTVYAFTF